MRKQYNIKVFLFGEDDLTEEEIARELALQELVGNTDLAESLESIEEAVEAISEMTRSGEIEEEDIATILSVYEKFPESIVGNKVAENLVKAAEKMLEEQSGAPAAKPAEGAAATDEGDTVDTDDSDIFAGVVSTKFKEEEFPTIDLKNVETYIKAKYNIDTTKKGLKSFFESVDKMRANSQKATEATEELTKLNELIGAMPVPIMEAIKAVNSGADYKQAFLEHTADNVLTFNSDKLSNKEQYEVVKHYFPEAVEAEADFDIKDPVIIKTLGLATTMLKKEQKLLADKNAAAVLSNKKSSEMFLSSVDEAKKYVEQEFPHFVKSEIELLSKQLDSIQSLFYNADGTVRKDAILNIALVKHGMQSIKNKDSKIKTLEKSKTVDNKVLADVKNGRKVEKVEEKARNPLSFAEKKSPYA